MFWVTRKKLLKGVQETNGRESSNDHDGETNAYLPLLTVKGFDDFFRLSGTLT